MAKEEDKTVVSHRKMLASAAAEMQKRLFPQHVAAASNDDQTCQLCEMAVTYAKVNKELQMQWRVCVPACRCQTGALTHRDTCLLPIGLLQLLLMQKL